MRTCSLAPVALMLMTVLAGAATARPADTCGSGALGLCPVAGDNAVLAARPGKAAALKPAGRTPTADWGAEKTVVAPVVAVPAARAELPVSFDTAPAVAAPPPPAPEWSPSTGGGGWWPTPPTWPNVMAPTPPLWK